MARATPSPEHPVARLLALERRHASVGFAELRARVLREEPGAWQVFVERYSRTVYTIALHLAGAGRDREETAQDIYAGVFERLARDGHRLLRRFRGDARFETYLFGAVRNEAAERRRRRARERARLVPLDARQPRAAGALAEDIGLDATRVVELVEQSLAGLAPRERLLLRLRFGAGLPLRRLAERMGLKDTNAAAYELTRTLRKLGLLERCRRTLRWSEAESRTILAHLRSWLAAGPGRGAPGASGEESA